MQSTFSVHNRVKQKSIPEMYLENSQIFGNLAVNFYITHEAKNTFQKKF